jgi:hypothetical protein
MSPSSFWPVRMAKSLWEGVHSAVTAPHDVFEGRLDPTSREGVGRALDFATTFGPIGPVTGARTLTTPALDAARTAADIGAPLPAGLVSSTPGMAKFTQGVRSWPVVGSKIDERLGETVGRVGENVGDMATERFGGLPDRSVAGAELRPALREAVAGNNARIDDAFAQLRDVINPDAGIEMARTRATLEAIAKQRGKARLDPTAGLEDVARLANEGGVDTPGLASFNGMQRMRTELSDRIKFAPNQGFGAGDLKLVRKAIGADMERAVQAHAVEGVEPAAALAAYRNANETAQQFIKANETLHQLGRVQSDERLVGNVVNAAKQKTGNSALIRQLRDQLPKADFDRIAGIAITELGMHPRTGEFSLERFGTSWRGMSNEAKTALFPDAAHRARLDRFADLDRFLKGSDKYRNTSGTAHAGFTGAAMMEGGEAALEALTGSPHRMMSMLAGLAGGGALGRWLARPATAASIERWLQTHRTAAGMSPLRRAALSRIATTNLANTLSGDPDFNKDEFNRAVGVQ